MPEGANAVETLARSVAAFGLEVARPNEPAEVSELVWERLLTRIRFERMTGLAVESAAGGSLRLSEVQAAALLAEHRGAMAWCLGVERKLVGLADAFDAEGIGFAVLKGASVAHTMYPETVPAIVRRRRSVGLDCRLRAGVRAVGTLGTRAAAARAPARVRGAVRQGQRPQAPGRSHRGRPASHARPRSVRPLDPSRGAARAPRALPPGRSEAQQARRHGDAGERRDARRRSGGGHPGSSRSATSLQVTNAGLVDWRVLERWCKAWHLTAVLDRALLALGVDARGGGAGRAHAALPFGAGGGAEGAAAVRGEPASLGRDGARDDPGDPGRAVEGGLRGRVGLPRQGVPGGANEVRQHGPRTCDVWASPLDGSGADGDGSRRREGGGARVRRLGDQPRARVARPGSPRDGVRSGPTAAGRAEGDVPGHQAARPTRTTSSRATTSPAS